jgi:hypothetical protein
MSLAMWIHGSCASGPLAVFSVTDWLRDWRNGFIARYLVFSFLEHPPARPGVLGSAAWLITFDRG